MGSTKEELLERDHYYLGKAANVADWERELIKEGLAQGKRLLPDYLSAEQPIFCPIWRLRLYVLQQLCCHTEIHPRYRVRVTPKDTVRQIIWGLNYRIRRCWSEDSPGKKACYVDLTPDPSDFTCTIVEIPIEW